MDVAKISPANGGNLPPVTIKELSTVVDKSKSTEREISDLSRSLYQSNIDLQNSTITSGTNNTSFNFQFLRQSEQKVSLNGSFSNDLTSGSISFSYNFIQTELIDGKSINREFEVNFDLSFTSSNSISMEKSEKKEDILHFLSRITKEIFEKLSDNNVNISALVLDAEDLKDLAEITDKKIIKLIYQLIEMIKIAAEAKKAANKNKNAKDVIYHPERIKQSIQETVTTNELNINYSFSIRETGKTDTPDKGN